MFSIFITNLNKDADITASHQNAYNIAAREKIKGINTRFTTRCLASGCNGNILSQYYHNWNL